LWARPNQDREPPRFVDCNARKRRRKCFSAEKKRKRLPAGSGPHLQPRIAEAGLEEDVTVVTRHKDRPVGGNACTVLRHATSKPSQMPSTAFIDSRAIQVPLIREAAPGNDRVRPILDGVIAAACPK